MLQSKWKKQELELLYQLKNKEGKTFKEIGKQIKRSTASVSKKYLRTDWVEFMKDPDSYLNGNESTPWTKTEVAQLYAYLKANKDYTFISKQLNRSRMAVETKSQKTDWDAWEAMFENPSELDEEGEMDEEDKEHFINQLEQALIVLCRHDHKRLNEITEVDFVRKTSLSEEQMLISFDELKDRVSKQLNLMGFGNPDVLELSEGTYIIVGDSHGKQTPTKMFKLLKAVNKELNATNIIHIGHILDDDNDISYNWGEIDNLIVLTKKEELQIVQEKRKNYEKTYNFNFEIARDVLVLGNDLVVMNQDLISDYVKTSIRQIDQEMVDNKVVVNCHRQEFVSKCSDEGVAYIASPGCLCKQHVIKTIRQIDFTDRRQVKVAYHDGFQKYRRMEHMMKLWKLGMLVVHVDGEGNHTIIPCPIQQLSKKLGFATSYFDKIITDKGVRNPSKKIFIHGDMHSPKHDPNILDIEEQICKDYNPDVLVNIGDSHDFRSLNHHEMDKGKFIDSDLLEESAKVYHVVKRMTNWANEKHMIFGNHERFARDFIGKYPQFKNYLDFNFICDIENLGYKLTDLKEVLKIGPSKFIHGDLIMFGQSGNKLEKASRTFGENVFIGHIHQPGIRFGCYSVGFAGALDQGYNEPTASSWMHGFGLSNHYMGMAFSTSIPIMDYNCEIKNKNYEPKNPENWDIKKFSARIVYETE
jgi:hypothetical protein